MHTYGLRDHAGMLADARRVGPYVEALRRVVTPGCTVVDIGTGTGVMAMAACRFGAARVYAIEPGDVIELARGIAADNGFADRIEFIQGVSLEVELPGRADVVVAEIHGLLPLFERSVETWIDARQRLLAPGGKMIPASETIFASVVAAPKLHEWLSSPWGQVAPGLDLRRGGRHAINQIYRAEFEASSLLAPAAVWAALDYRTIETPDVSRRLSFRASRAATAHGLGLWFDSQLADGVTMSNAPGAPALIFGNAFMPWPEPVELAAGDTIEAEIGATLVGDRYVWRWESRVASGGTTHAHFRQSQFDGAIIVPERLRRQAASHEARLNEEGEIHREALAGMAQRRRLGDIATDLQARFPKRFPRWQDALNWVGDLALRCSD